MHQAVYGGESTFGGFSWHKEMLLYTAEAAAPPTTSWWEDEEAAANATLGGPTSTEKIHVSPDAAIVAGQGDKFVWKESWGEGHSNAIAPRLFTLDVVKGVVQQVLAEERAVQGMSLGQAQFFAMPSDVHAHAIVFVAWPASSRRLGLKYYTARPSSVFYASL